MWSDNRLSSPAAVLAMLFTTIALAGCSAPPSSFTIPDADVTIAGQGFASVPVSTGNAVTAQMAQFRDLGGFSGTLGQGDVGDGQAGYEDDDNEGDMAVPQGQRAGQRCTHPRLDRHRGRIAHHGLLPTV